MPKRCGCGDTCACVIQGGPGIDVDGSGTVDQPYVITNAVDALADQVTFDDTGNVDFTTIGDGTALSPMHVYGSAHLKLTELSDVVSAAPTNGQVPVWRSDHWVFEPQSGTGGGGTGADEVVISATTPTVVAGDPEIWIDTSTAQTGDPALPSPANLYVSTTAVITATAETENPTTVRVSLTNASTSRRILVKVEGSSTYEQTNGISNSQTMFAGLKVVSGTATPLDPTAPEVAWRHAVEANESSSSEASYTYGYFWLPAGATATWGLTSWKTNATATVQTRNANITAIPIRYE